MRGLAVVLAAAAGWVLAGAPLPNNAGATRSRLPNLATIATALVVGVVVGLITLLLTGVVAVVTAVGVLAASLPLGLSAAKERAKRQEVIETWPDFLSGVRGFLSAGRSLPEAFIEAGKRTGGGLGELSEEVRRRTSQGAAFAEALEYTRRSLADPTTDRAITLISVAHRSGGGRVATVLADAGASIADEVRLRKAHEASLTQQRMTAMVALLAPWILLVITVATNEAAAAAYRTARGQSIILFGLGATGIGYLAARSAARLSEPRRILR
ncbi:MAG: type II secretion system F family protein [Acidimicrobiia bacterium]|nr:type II secretion system F family protein [Acidimicrobiia bacterium]NNL27921.1 hypothetical protein [Acidimicrobiia bacterium]